ncbi:MAG: cell wall-binding repeat-containing protein [Acidimicrobiales bacterium]|nr:cell wall-binding repeat-containing protein [Acidimicrobiales bacterium]
MPRHHHRFVVPLLCALGLVVSIVAIPEPAAAQPVFRIAGPDRYTTAALISGQFAPSGAPVFIASGENYPDAIAAGWISGVAGFPVLLVRRDSIPTVTQNELARLAPPGIYVLGGTAAVSDAVFAQLGQPGVAVIRLAGADRYATAAEIANNFAAPAMVVSQPTVLVASGTDFADAMVAGAAGAVYGGLPLLLVPPNGPLSLPVVNALTTLAGAGYVNIAIMGGPAEVSPAVEAALAGLGFAVARVPGLNAYERSVAIWLFLPPAAYDVVVTTGENWPDGLAGALFTGQAQAAGITANQNVMVLTRTACVPGVVAAGIAAAAPSRITILGGNAAVSPAVEAGTVCP